jgi:surface protein
MVCPKCHNSSLITFNDYKIKLNCCGEFTLEEYHQLLETQSSQKSQNENPIIIYSRRDLINEERQESEINEYICQSHEKKYIFYCEKCKKDFCESCKCEHGKKYLIEFEKMPKDINEKELSDKIKDFKSDIDDIISILNKIKENIDVYYEINKEMNDSYKNNQYTILKNIETINDYNKKVMNDINEIIKQDKILLKFVKLYHIYEKMTTKNNQPVSESSNRINNNNENNNNSAQNSINSISNVDIKLKLKINNKQNLKQLKIFGDKFVENNLNCKMIINKDSYKNEARIINDSWEQIKTHIDSKNINLENIIIDLKNLNTNIDLSYMFNDCRNIEYLEFIQFNVANISNISHMFCNCTSLAEIKKMFTNTNEVTSMSRVFKNCEKLSDLSDISGWDTSKVTDMSEMFYKCC